MSKKNRSKKANQAKEQTSTPLADALAEAQRATKPAKAKAGKERRPCACGCGEETTNTFVSGHDGRVHGWFLAVARGDFLPEGLRTEQLRVAFSRWDGSASVRAAFAEAKPA